MQIFILGAIGWWCITILIAIYIFFAIDKSINLFWPIVALLFYIGFIQFSGLNLFKFVTQHPLESTGYIAGYFVIGFTWSFIKWWLYVTTIADKIKERVAAYKKNIPIPSNLSTYVNSQHSPRTYKQWEIQNFQSNLEKPILSQSKNKNKITLWVIYWPISMIWSLLDDFVKKLVRHLITKFQKLYQSIVDRAFKSIDEIEQ